MAVSRKRSSSSLDENEPPKPAVKKARAAPKSKKAAKDIGTCSYTKKDIGDRVKASLALEKYHIPRTHFKMDMDLKFFRNFFIDNDSLTKPLQPTPEDFDEITPVVMIEMGNKSAGEILGVSKVKGGNRMATTHLAAMCVVFRPKQGKCDIWTTV
ncbi:hypothetical protein BT63DRAFT_424209 [Microthyrium microscopicum]|uniref:Uncharacterized protein n=1 Tax=Microthyrium microscopicum TaxID=703497 RepID=A0A6A6UDC0_9PEZI|nr:hypothetical protein BT63DRAFT_424209 [Microthyrium microscopicum]